MSQSTWSLVGKSHPLSRDLPGFARELGSMERFVVVTQSQHVGLLSNALLIVSKQPITEDLLRKALRRLMQMIPTLRFVIRDKYPDGTALSCPVFIEAASPVLYLEILPDATSWVEVLSKELSRSYDIYDGPLWRVKFLPNVNLNMADDMFQHETVLVFSFLHAIVDGMSYQRLFGHFLDCLEAVSSGDTTPPVQFCCQPPLDHYINDHPKITDPVFKLFFKLLLGSKCGRKFLSWMSGLGTCNEYLSKYQLPIELDPATPQKTSLVPMVIPRELTASIIRACRARSVTVHSAVHTAAALAYGMLVQDSKLTEKDMKISSPCMVNLRFLSESLTLNSYGAYSCGFGLDFHISKNADKYTLFWDNVHSCLKQLKEKMANKSYLDFHHSSGLMLPALEQYKPNLRELSPYKYGRDEFGFLFTNMMRCDFLSRDAEGATFKLMGRFGGTGDHTTGHILMNNLNTFNGQMYWSVLYSTHIITKAKIQKYADMVKELLIENCGDTEV